MKKCRHCGGDLVKITPIRKTPPRLGERMYWWIHTETGQEYCGEASPGRRWKYAEPLSGVLTEGNNKDGSISEFGYIMARSAIAEAKKVGFIRGGSPHGVEVFELNAVQLETLIAYAVDQTAKELY